MTPDAAPEPAQEMPAARRWRWRIVFMLLLVSTINYLDRGTLAVVIPRLRGLFHISDAQYASVVQSFFYAYAAMYALSGWIMDRLGPRLGLGLSAAWWSFAAAGNGLVQGILGLRVFQFLLGIGEPAMFPAALKFAQERFPPRQRALAMGVFNAGTSLGGTLAPPLVVFLMLRYSWRIAFFSVGMVGLLWVCGWWWVNRAGAMTRAGVREIERSPAAASSAPRPGWGAMMRHPQVWGILAGRACSDPAWYFYLFWLPTYLYKVRHFSLVAIGAYGALVPALASAVGNVAGGWLSGVLTRFVSPIQARKLVMLITVAAMPLIYFGTHSASNTVVIAAISLATWMHQSWSVNLQTLPADSCPPAVSGRVAGLSGTAGTLASIPFTTLIGWAAGQHHYNWIFLAATTIYPIGWILVSILVRKRWEDASLAIA